MPGHFTPSHPTPVVRQPATLVSDSSGSFVMVSLVRRRERRMRELLTLAANWADRPCAVYWGQEGNTIILEGDEGWCRVWIVRIEKRVCIVLSARWEIKIARVNYLTRHLHGSASFAMHNTMIRRANYMETTCKRGRPLLCAWCRPFPDQPVRWVSRDMPFKLTSLFVSLDPPSCDSVWQTWWLIMHSCCRKMVHLWYEATNSHTIWN